MRAAPQEPGPGGRKAGRAVRVLGGVAKAVGACVLLAALVAVAALIALDSGPGRRFVVREVNGLLASTFQGKVTIERVRHLGLWGLSGLDATVEDPAGRRVASLEGLRVDVGTIAFARSALVRRKEPLTIPLTALEIDSADVVLDEDPAGHLELAEAFAPTPLKGPPKGEARPVRLIVERIALGHGRAHGRLSRDTSAEPLDVELSDLTGAATYAPDALDTLFDARLDGVRVLAKRIAGDADVAGSLRARLHGRGGADARPEGTLVWDGTAGVVAHSVRASFDGHDVDAVVDVPDVSPEQIRSVWPDSPLDRRARLHAEAHGPLAGVDVSMRARLGMGALDADGRLVLEGESSARLHLSARDLDVQAFAKSAPPSRLGLTGDVSAAVQPGGSPEGSASLRFLGGPLGDGDLPPVSIRARVSSRAGSQILSFQVDSTADDLRNVPGVGRALGGSASLSAACRVDVTRRRVEGSLRARAAGLRRAADRVEALSVEATVAGPLAAPEVDASLRSTGLVAGGLHLTSADAVVRGPVLRPHVAVDLRGPDIPDLDAEADVGLKPSLSVSNLRADLSQAGERAHVEARSVTLGPESV
ncbi:MAG TPA: hypothetical protein VKU41_24050, partial [Polyangiaceae bacterium]|nr:hypothetical protein [Polyangiaceae bacterium]